MQEKSDTISIFSDRIEQLRTELDGSMVAVAKALDVSRTMIYDIKNGKVPISAKMLRKLESAEKAVRSLKQTEPPLSAPVDALCKRIRDEFYLPTDADFAGRSMAESSAILRAMSEGLDEMERRRSLYLSVARQHTQAQTLSAQVIASGVQSKAAGRDLIEHHAFNLAPGDGAEFLPKILGIAKNKPEIPEGLMAKVMEQHQAVEKLANLKRQANLEASGSAQSPPVRVRKVP